MRVLSLIASVLLAGSAFAQTPSAVFTPDQRDLEVPTYINASVARVDTRNNTITFRSESGDTVLTVEGDAISELGRLRAGDQVVLGYRTESRSGRPVRIVTAIRAGENMAGRGTVATSSLTATNDAVASSVMTGRVVGVDASGRTLTLADAEGRTETLAVQGSALGVLGNLGLGQQVEVAFTPAAAGLSGGVVSSNVFGTAGGIQPVGTNFVTGQVVSVDRTGALTLQTPFGTQVFTGGTGSVAVSDLSSLRGQTVRLDLASGGSFTAATPIGAGFGAGRSSAPSRVTRGAAGGASTGTVTGAATTGTTGANTVSNAGTPVSGGSAVTGSAVTSNRGTFSTPVTGRASSFATTGGVTDARAGAVTSTGTVRGAATVGPRGTAGGTVSTLGTVNTLNSASQTGTPTGTTAVVVPGAAGTSVVGGTIPGAPVGTIPGTTTASAAGTVPSRLISTPSTLTGSNTGTFNTPLGTLPNAATPLPGTPNSSGLAAVGGAGTVSFPGAAGTVDAGGNISAPVSPYAAVIPSLPSVIGTLNVVPPAPSAPTLAEQLPVGAARDIATRDYDNAVRTLAMKANEIDMHWFRYRDGCLRQNSTDADLDRALFGPNRDRQWFILFDEDVRTPADDNCRQLRVEMNRMAMDWRDLMTRAEDTARSHDVLPGAMREVRQRYRVEF